MINRYENLNYSEQALGKMSLCRTCAFMDRIVFTYDDDFSELLWMWPDEQCGGHFYSEANRLCKDDETKYGVVINECPYYRKTSFAFYKDYLRSEHWKRKRREIIEKAGLKCTLCGSAVNLNVHHLTYDRIGCEDDEDLICVCKECHQKLHESKGE